MKTIMPLEGLKVVELAAWVFVPATGGHLADMGADVIKIERPVVGDPCRGVMGHIPASDFNYTFEMINRNKKSIVLDLKNESARSIVHKLIEKSDVFITNYKSNTLEEFNLDYDTLSRINPGLIYGMGSGWGQHGAPDPDENVFDYLAFARSGLQFIMGEPGIPPQSLPGMSDNPSGLALAYGILLALRHRDQTGKGQLVDASLLRTFLNLIGRMSFQGFLSVRNESIPVPRTAPRTAFINIYRTKDNRWIQFCMGKTDLYWPLLLKAIGREDLENDERFSTPEKKQEKAPELAAIFDEAISKFTLSEWAERCKVANVAWAPVQSFSELENDPRFMANMPSLIYEHPQHGPIKETGFPVELSKSPGTIRTASPELGQHTEEILLDLGYQWEDILQLRELGAISFQ